MRARRRRDPRPGRRPPSRACPALRRYRPGPATRRSAPASVPRPAYRDIVEYFRAPRRSPSCSGARQARDAWVDAHGLTFGVDGEERPFAVDLVPRVISPHEWEELGPGSIQRARAIESFLRDVYGEQRILADGVLPRDVVLGSPGWRDEATAAAGRRRPRAGHGLRHRPQRVRRLAGARGQRPLPQRCRLRHRRPPAHGRRHARPAPPGRARRTRPPRYELLRSTLLAHAEPAPAPRCCPAGRSSSAWFEHRRLADGAGLLLVTADDLDVVGGRVVHRGTAASRSASSTCGWTTSSSTSSTPPAGRSAPRSSTSPPPGGVVARQRPGQRRRRRQVDVLASCPS